MPRRVSLPGAAELFRPTTAPVEAHDADKAPDTDGRGADRPDRGSSKRPGGTGRVRHDQKITVYVTTDELVALESARLRLRAHGISADRGRLVREAIAIALADLDANQGDSSLARRLTD